MKDAVLMFIWGIMLGAIIVLHGLSYHLAEQCDKDNRVYIQQWYECHPEKEFK